jgi:hypothetical protein
MHAQPHVGVGKAYGLALHARRDTRVTRTVGCTYTCVCTWQHNRCVYGLESCRAAGLMLVMLVHVLLLVLVVLVVVLACSPQFLANPPKALDGTAAGQYCAVTGGMHSTAQHSNVSVTCLCGLQIQVTEDSRYQGLCGGLVQVPTGQCKQKCAAQGWRARAHVRQRKEGCADCCGGDCCRSAAYQINMQAACRPGKLCPK